jgi:hypothetical protein
MATFRHPLTGRAAALSLLTLALGACADVPAEAPDPAVAPEVPAALAADPCGAGGCAPKIDAADFAGIPGAGVQFVDFPAQKNSANARWGTALNDIEAHLPASYGTTYRDADKVTHGHETSHGIHSHIRNHLNDTGQRANGFYVLENRAVLVVEPNVRKSQVGPFIPAALRGSRYATYVTGQVEWDDRVLYLWDEWNAYINGGEVAIDLQGAGLWDQGSRDAVAGLLEFSVYALAVGMAVEQHDPAYFRGNAQFREFLAFNTLRAMDLFRVGRALAPFARADQDAYYEKLRNGPEAEPIRAFAERLFGAAFARHALFGEPMPAPDEPDVPETPDEPVEPEPPVEPDVPVEPDTPVEPDVPADPDSPVEPNVPDETLPDAEGDLPDPPGEDADADGVSDDVDLCTRTPAGKRVWTDGAWLGCAEGERRDGPPPGPNGPDVPDDPNVPDGPVEPVDSDADGVVDTEDVCLGTAAGARVWGQGLWKGCAGGQHANNTHSAGPDADGDGVPDADDRCGGSPAGRPVWREGDWLGCAGGQRKG